MTHDSNERLNGDAAVKIWAGRQDGQRAGSETLRQFAVAGGRGDRV